MSCAPPTPKVTFPLSQIQSTKLRKPLDNLITNSCSEYKYE